MLLHPLTADRSIPRLTGVHMRNIRGSLNDFYEVFPDAGDVDFSNLMRILRDTQFSGSIRPDHIPGHPDDPGGFRAFAFGYAYIKALIQAVNNEVLRSSLILMLRDYS